MNALGPFVVTGMVIGAGALLIILGALRSPVRLADALAVLDGSVPETRETHPKRKGLEALGDWLHGTLRLPLTRNQQRLLLLSGRSIADFFAEKLVLATTGLFLPAIWLVVQVVLGNPTTPVPLLLGPVLGVGGYFLADLRLAKTSRQVSRSTSEAVHTFFDLVALERLANASATQAVTQAATISDAPRLPRTGVRRGPGGQAWRPGPGPATTAARRRAAHRFVVGHVLLVSADSHCCGVRSPFSTGSRSPRSGRCRARGA